MIVENQDIRKQHFNYLKQILPRKQYPAEIIDYGINKALAHPNNGRVKEGERASYWKQPPLSGNNLQSQQSAIIPSGQENTSRVERKLLTKVHDMSKTKVIHSQRQPRNLKQMLTISYISSQKDTDPEVKICGTKNMLLFETGWRTHLLCHKWNILDKTLDELHLKELDLHNNMCRMWT